MVREVVMREVIGRGEVIGWQEVVKLPKTGAVVMEVGRW